MVVSSLRGNRSRSNYEIKWVVAIFKATPPSINDLLTMLPNVPTLINNGGCNHVTSLLGFSLGWKVITSPLLHISTFFAKVMIKMFLSIWLFLEIWFIISLWGYKIWINLNKLNLAFVFLSCSIMSKLIEYLGSSFSHVIGIIATLGLPLVSVAYTSSWKITLTYCSSSISSTLVGHT